MEKARWVPFVALALVIGGGAAGGETWNDWFGDPPPAPTPAAADRPDERFYAGVDGLVMYTLPSASSDVVARLPLHEPVTRNGLVRGYANVTTDAGLQGWVDNTELLWRLPAAPATPGAPAET